jgi:hypothetical protein
MWNSWVDREVILKVKENCKKHIDWFYLRSLKKANVRDRMLNEELYISLSYLDFKTQSSDCQFVPLDIYQKSDRINARIKEKKDISNVLLNASQSIQIKNMFIDCIKHVEQFISKIKIILIDKDISKNDLPNFLSSELEKVLRAGKKGRYYLRTLQDYYILWYLLQPLNMAMTNFHRKEIKKDLKNIYRYMKNIPESDVEGNLGFDNFTMLVNNFHNKYKIDQRKLKLTDKEKFDLIKKQDHKCSISGAKIFLGDDIEVDHTKPIAIGGEDAVNNIGISHKHFNRIKGTKIIE